MGKLSNLPEGTQLNSFFFFFETGTRVAHTLVSNSRAQATLPPQFPEELGPQEHLAKSQEVTDLGLELRESVWFS